MKRAARLTGMVLLGVAAGTLPAAAKALVCLAPTLPAEAGKPLKDLDALEFYSDEGNPLQAYTAPFTRHQSGPDANGNTRNVYGVWGAKADGAAIVFAGTTPLSFALAELARTYASLARDDEETAFMADSVPGIVCYSVVKEEP